MTHLKYKGHGSFIVVKPSTKPSNFRLPIDDIKANYYAQAHINQLNDFTNKTSKNKTSSTLEQPKTINIINPKPSQQYRKSIIIIRISNPMGNQLCEATQQSPYKARIMEICNGVEDKEAKAKLQPITFSDHGSAREHAYKDDNEDGVRENTLDHFNITKEDMSPMLKDKPQATPFTADNIREQQTSPNKREQTSSYSSDYLSQSPTTKLAKFNLNSVYLKHMNTQQQQGNLAYEPMPVPFSVIKMVLSKKLVPFIEQEKQKFFKQYDKNDQSFRLFKQGCYGHLKSNNEAVFVNSNYFYEGSFILGAKGEFLPEKQGIYITEDGKYVGEFSKGKPQGKGVYVMFEGDDYNKRTTYSGDWQNGMLVKGTVENHLFKYQGSLKNRKPHGQGKLFMKVSKVLYKGQFVDGKYHGQKGFYETSEYTYSGDFMNGKKHGRGVLSEKASALQAFNKKLRKEQRYQGTWRQDKLQERIVTSTTTA